MPQDHLLTAAPSTIRAIAMVFVLLGGVALLTMAPFELGTIRLAGVSLLWWYGAVAAPLAAVAITAAALVQASRRRARDAAGTTPVPAPE